MESLDVQQLESLFYVLLGVIAVVLSALIVYVVAANRRQRAKMAQAYEADRLAPRPALHVTGHVLSLVRDEMGGALEVEVDGATYRRLGDIEDPQLRRQVVGAALELIEFTGALDHDVVAPSPIEKTHSWREDLREGSKAELERIRTTPTEGQTQPRAPVAPEEVEEQFLNLLTEMGQAPPPPERPSLVSSVRQRMTAKPTEPDQAHTVVDDIEDIVQRRVQLIPALVGRNLHVRPGPGDSVSFVFEGQEYKHLDEVPNMTAQQLIRDAIREWEETA